MIDQAYYECFERLTNAMTNPNGFNLKQVYSILGELCQILRVCRGVAVFYDGDEQEKQGKGEQYICYDNGAETDTSMTLRTVVPGGIIVSCTVFHEKGNEPWTEQEKSRLETAMQLIVSFLNRTRMNRLVEDLVMHDDAGYTNSRFFMKRLDEMGPELHHHAALRFNLKHFSAVNMEIGREKSDLVMKRFINELEEVAGEGSVVCRLVSDNFVMVCDQEYLGAVMGHFEGSSIPYDDENTIMISATAGIFLMEEDFTYNGAADIIERITNAYNVARDNATGDVVFSSQGY